MAWPVLHCFMLQGEGALKGPPKGARSGALYTYMYIYIYICIYIYINKYRKKYIYIMSVFDASLALRITRHTIKKAQTTGPISILYPHGHVHRHIEIHTYMCI